MSSVISIRRGVLALSPVIVFLSVYLVVSLIQSDFYCMPISVALLAGTVWAVVISGDSPLWRRLEVLSRAAGQADIIYMLWIFILAGCFAALAKSIGAVNATVDLTLTLFSSDFVVPGLFIAACLISLSIGTSVGTVVALAPFAVDLAGPGGEAVAYFVAVVLGGAFFGDNLSFISDTTIAATRTQGCAMADKFRVNLWIALPAAVTVLVLYVLMGHDVPVREAASHSEWWLVLPYVVVVVLAAAGINVAAVLVVGIISAIAAGLVLGEDMMGMAGTMGEGIESMGELIIITLLASGMLGMVKAMGGIDWLLNRISGHVRGPRGAQGCIAVLVGMVNVCTANNTVAILTVGEIAADLSRRFGVDPRKSASLLDTASCVMQCMIPYGAQTLLAASLAGISPAAPWPYLYYMWALAAFTVLSIVFRFPRLDRQEV